ncbi:hypothetical protein HYT53_01310 [Candidatus Woesearchaeota archaeon]|nr:hypothetical protein [Candidatus Woesearchaeota archaeon]
MLEQILGLLLGIVIGFIMVYKNKGRTSTTAGGATGGTGTSGTGGPTGGTATGDAGEAERQRREEERQRQDRQRQEEEARRQREERQRQEEERLRQEEERRRRGTGRRGTRTGDFSAKFKEKPPDEHRQNVEQWENIKRSYQSGRTNLFRMLIDVKNTTWSNGWEPDVKLVKDVTNFIVEEFTRHPELLSNSIELGKIRRGIIFIFHPDRVGKREEEGRTAENHIINKLYTDIIKSFNVFFDSLEDSLKKRYHINYSISLGKLKHDIDKCFK